jgi:SAM-dependent methyltransferase
MADARMSSPSSARNTVPILAVLKAHLPARGRVLEVACGAGEHARAFSQALPGLDWTPSDPDPNALASAQAWRADGPANLQPPVRLDADDDATWPDETFQALYCANMIHISPWAATEGLMRLAGRVLTYPGGLLVLYGPYLEADIETAPSNLAFDESLTARNPAWGIRRREDVVALARDHGLAFTLRVQMPANNLMLLFRRV